MFRRTAGLVACLAALAVPATSDAYLTVGSELLAPPDQTLTCPVGCDALYIGGEGLDQIPIDGVIVRWQTRARTAAATNAKLLVARPGDFPTYRKIAEATGTTTTTGVTSFAARIPVRRGDWIGLGSAGDSIPFRTLAGAAFHRMPVMGDEPVSTFGTENSRDLPVAVDVEPDADRDGFGDETQDECASDAARQVAPCSGTLVGPSLTGTWTAFTGPAAAYFAVGGPAPAALASDGVIVRWRVRAGAGSFGAQILRPDPAGWRHVADLPSTGEVPASDATSILTLPVSVPVRAGDVLGLRTTAGATFVRRLAPVGATIVFQPPLAPSSAGAPTGSQAFQFGVNADVEPDADGDGLGDLTQDTPPPAAPSPNPPAPIAPAPQIVTVTQTGTRVVVRPGAARLAVTRLRYRGTPSLAVPLSCPASAESCTGVLELKVGRRAAGRQAFSLRAGQRKAVTVKLNARARRALRKGGRVSARIVPAGPKPTNGALTLTR